MQTHQAQLRDLNHGQSSARWNIFMFYHLFFEALKEYFFSFNILQYISFELIYATITALLLSLFLGPMMITYLKKLKIGQYIREMGHKHISVKQELPQWVES